MNLDQEQLAARVAAYKEHGSERKACDALGISKTALHKSLVRAASFGLMGTAPVLPGYRVARVTNTPKGDYVQQKPDIGAPYEPINSLAVKGRTTWADIQPDGSRVATREVIMERADAAQREAVFRAMVDALKEDLPRMVPTVAPPLLAADRMNQFIVTDSHFGMLAWAEETGADYDLRIAERLLLDWFAAAIAGAPEAHTAVFAQLGDLMHHDALESVTPAHHHVLDADSRLQKIVRVVIRTVRRAIGMLLDRHQHVHVVMASGNHDPAGSVWLREMLAVMYENEPRITIDTSPALYHKFVWGKTVNFFHHGHKADMKTIDKKVAGEFRAEYGAADYAYAHIGHKHSDEGIKTELMYVERHETLAGRDAYAASGPWAKSGRSAKRITYDKRFGEVDRGRMTPEMVAGAHAASKYAAANDNQPKRAAA